MTSYYNALHLEIEGLPDGAAAFISDVSGLIENAISEGMGPEEVASIGCFEHSSQAAAAQIMRMHEGDVPGLRFETRSDAEGRPAALIITSAEYAEVDYLALILQAAMNEFDFPGPIAFQWSCLATEDTVSAYGGGAGVVTPDKIYIQSTREWLDATIAKIAPELESLTDIAQQATGAPRKSAEYAVSVKDVQAAASMKLDIELSEEAANEALAQLDVEAIAAAAELAAENDRSASAAVQDEIAGQILLMTYGADGKPPAP